MELKLKFIFNEDLPEYKDMEENTIYVSEEDKVSKHLCLCGCKSLVVMDLDRVNGWLLKENNNKYSFVPSVGNFQLECKSHYFITDSKVVWCK